jgi:predicted ferric reductase
MSAYLMLFLNVVLGLAVHSRFLDELMARWRSLDLHQFTGLLGLGFLAIHTLALLGDRYIGFTVPQLLVPMASAYRPAWTALGIIAFYMILTVVASSYLRSHIGYRLWRAIHYLSFGAYLLALAHGLLAGTDTGERWAQALYWSTGGLVLILIFQRFRSVGERREVKLSDRRAANGVG